LKINNGGFSNNFSFGRKYSMNSFLQRQQAPFLVFAITFLSLYDLVFIYQSYEEVNINEARYLAICH